ncbi:MAG: helix-turn-helix domain-containing protein [Actinobacteria bacterium]|nr:helix-turn-helix domain-containing protein [Actinomycetota bacterium]
MADDPALIWQQDHTPRRPVTPRNEAAGVPEPVPDSPIPGGRISLREARHQFGVPASTLASWARSGRLDAVKAGGAWMVTAASVAARLSHRHAGKPRAGGATRTDATAARPDGTTMLVPRDAWDKLLDQLGNLHEAGQMLAEARERAAKAETEVVFLRERLAEIRAERDGLRIGPSAGAAEPQHPGLWRRLGHAIRPGPPRRDGD